MTKALADLVLGCGTRLIDLPVDAVLWTETYRDPRWRCPFEIAAVLQWSVLSAYPYRTSRHRDAQWLIICHTLQPDYAPTVNGAGNLAEQASDPIRTVEECFTNQVDAWKHVLRRQQDGLAWAQKQLDEASAAAAVREAKEQA